MKVVTISGTAGAGKTTLIRMLVEHYHALGRRSAVIVNEAGEATYDDAFVGATGLAVEQLQGG